MIEQFGDKMKIVDLVASGLYYATRKDKTSTQQYEDILPMLKQKFEDRAVMFLEILDQNNLIVVTAKSQEKKEQKPDQVENLEVFINNYLKKVEKPKNIAKFFPSKSLAMNIIESGII
jgi:hypothetical protein